MESRLFYCYSMRLFRALKANGFSYLYKGLNKKSGRIYYVFKGTKPLNYYKDNIYQNERDLF